MLLTAEGRSDRRAAIQSGKPENSRSAKPYPGDFLGAGRRCRFEFVPNLRFPRIEIVTMMKLDKNGTLILLAAAMLPMGAVLGFLASLWLAEQTEGGQPVSLQAKSRATASPVAPRTVAAGAREDEAAAVALQTPAPPAAAPAPVTAPTAGPSGIYSLQVGAFLDLVLAKRLADAIAATNGSPAIVASADGQGRVWHSVRVGSYPSEFAASSQAGMLLRRNGLATTIVRTGSGVE